MPKINSSSRFRTQHTYADRYTEAQRIRGKYPDRIPVICEKIWNTKLKELDRSKFLIPADFTIGQFMYVIRKRLRLASEKAIFLFVSGNIPSSGSIMSILYDNYKDEDGFLYISYSEENVFG